MGRRPDQQAALRLKDDTVASLKLDLSQHHAEYGILKERVVMLEEQLQNVTTAWAISKAELTTATTRAVQAEARAAAAATAASVTGEEGSMVASQNAREPSSIQWPAGTLRVCRWY